MRIGIYNPNLSTKGGGEKVCLALAEALSPGNDILILTHTTLEKDELESYFGVNLNRTQISVMKKHPLIEKIKQSRLIPNHFSKAIENYLIFRRAKSLDLDIFVNNAYNTEIPSPAPKGVYMCMFPHKLLDKADMSIVKRLYISLVDDVSRRLMHPTSKTWLDTYQTITANSMFTQKYIQQYWDRESSIIYPICDDMSVSSVKKQKYILNVGRFFHNNGITHHKRHDFLVDTFIKMKDLHEKGWELHLAGTVNENNEDMRYVIDLMKRSEGYPVRLHLETPLHDLKKLYTGASIYWHATGYGANASRNPERQEHFGISTVEAMTTGAVPIVIKSAGQKEIVTEGKNGYLWKSEDELMTKTRAVIKAGLSVVSKNAQKRSKDFDKASFQQQVVDVFEKLY